MRRRLLDNWGLVAGVLLGVLAFVLLGIALHNLAGAESDPEPGCVLLPIVAGKTTVLVPICEDDQ